MRPGYLVPLGAALLSAALAAGADPKSDATVRKGREAAAKAKTLQAEMVLTMEGGPAQKMTLRGPIRLMKPNYARLALKSDPAGVDIEMISTGKEIFEVERGQKTYRKRDVDPKAANLFGSADEMPVISGFFGPEDLLAGTMHRAAGTKQVDGRSYDVVELTGLEQGEKRLLYFGPGGLLEGMEVQPSQPGAPAGSVWLKNIRLDTPMQAQQFAFQPPAGFEMEKSPDDALLPVGAPAPDFRLPQPTGGLLSLEEALKGKKAVLVNFWFHG